MTITAAIAMHPAVLRARIAVLLPICLSAETPFDVAAAVDDLLDDTWDHDSVSAATRPILGMHAAVDLLSDREHAAGQECGEEPMLHGHPNDPYADHDGRWERWEMAMRRATAAAGQQFRLDMQTLLRAVDQALACPTEAAMVEASWPHPLLEAV